MIIVFAKSAKHCKISANLHVQTSYKSQTAAFAFFILECPKIYSYFTESNRESAIIRIKRALVLNRHAKRAEKCKATIFLDVKSDFDPRLRGGSVFFFFFFHQEPSRKVNEDLVDAVSPKCPDNVIKVTISTRLGKFLNRLLIIYKCCKQTGRTLVVPVHISSENLFHPLNS